MHRNVVALQLHAAGHARLALIDREVARLHAQGDRTDRDEMLDARLDAERFLAQVKADNASALTPTITGVEAQVVDAMERSSSDIPAARDLHPMPREAA